MTKEFATTHVRNLARLAQRYGLRAAWEHQKDMLEIPRRDNQGVADITDYLLGYNLQPELTGSAVGKQEEGNDIIEEFNRFVRVLGIPKALIEKVDEHDIDFRAKGDLLSRERAQYNLHEKGEEVTIGETPFKIIRNNMGEERFYVGHFTDGRALLRNLDSGTPYDISFVVNRDPFEELEKIFGPSTYENIQ